jgi:type II secretory pathway pseudopilin PulG
MNKKAFTVIELLIVIGIIMLLAAGLFVSVNPAVKLAEARDNQRETHLHAINRAVKEKIAKDGWEGCPALPETPTTISSSGYNLYDCIYPEYLSTPVYDPQAGVFSSTSDYETGYEIAMSSFDYTYLSATGETRDITLGSLSSGGGDGGSFTCGDDITFTYNGSEVTYGTVSASDECWMDKNLGASRVAQAVDDTQAFGDYFQWGRPDDGHQDRTSGTTATLAVSDQPGHSNFITNNSSPNDWRNPQNDDMWNDDGTGTK